MRDYSKLIELAKKNNGIIYTKDVVKKRIPRDYLSYAVKDNVLDYHSLGVYVLKSTLVDEYSILQNKYKHIVFSHATAGYILNLTKRDPLVTEFTVAYGTNTSKFLRMGYCVHTSRTYDMGITSAKTILGNQIKVYNAERTVCDMFNPRIEADEEVKFEILSNYILGEGKNLNKLNKYAKILKVDKYIESGVKVLL